MWQDVWEFPQGEHDLRYTVDVRGRSHMEDIALPAAVQTVACGSGS